MSIEQLNRTLQRTTGQLANTQDLRAFLGHILHEMVLLYGARFAHLLTFDAADETLSYAAGADPDGYHLDPQEDEPEFFKTPFVAEQLSVFGWSRGLHREAVLSRDAGEAPPHPELADWFRVHRIEEALALVLLAGEEPVGLVGLAFQTPPALSPGQRELFHALANQAALAIRMATLAEQAREAALARERERAAEERAAELSRANAVLQTAAEEVAAAGDPAHLPGRFLLAAVTAAGATGGALFTRISGTSFSPRAVIAEGRAIPPEEWQTDPVLERFEARTAEDPTGYFATLIRGENQWLTVDPAGPWWWPDTAAHHQARGTRTIWHVPMVLAGECVGFMGLTFAHQEPPSEAQVDLVRTLARQATLVLRLAELAEQAKENAVAAERAANTIRQAEALARANAATRTTLAHLAERPDLQSFLGHVLREVAARLSVTVASLWFYDLERRQAELHLVYTDERVIPGREFDHPNAGSPAVYPPGNAFWHTLTVLREPRLIRGVQDNEDLPPEQRTYFQQRGVQGLLAVPLVYGEKAIGMISVCLTSEECPSPEGLELVQTLANQATLAIELGRLGEAAMQAAVAEDRNRLAREIHDSLAQAFTGIALHLGGAERLLDAAHQDLRTHLLLARELAREGLAEARRSVRALRPLALDSVNLPDALAQLAARTSHTLSREVKVEIRGEYEPLPTEVEDHLLRIAQEALTNVVRHAAPERVRVVLDYGTEAIHLLVADDGQGFDLRSGITKGFGLMSMRERAVRIGAELTISSVPGRGTTLDLAFDRQQLQLPIGRGDR